MEALAGANLSDTRFLAVTRNGCGGPHQVNAALRPYYPTGYLITPLCVNPGIDTFSLPPAAQAGTGACWARLFFVFQSKISAPVGTAPVSR